MVNFIRIGIDVISWLFQGLIISQLSHNESLLLALFNKQIFSEFLTSNIVSISDNTMSYLSFEFNPI